MPKVSFSKNHPPIVVSREVNLMKALLEGGLPVASSCAGEGVCAKCRVTVVEGAKNLSVEGDIEHFLRVKHKIPPSQRVSCQVKVLGDVTLDTSYW